MKYNNKVNRDIVLEVELVNLMQTNPNDEIASELLSLLIKHNVKKTKPSKNLQNYINDYFLNLKNYSIPDKIFTVAKRIGRPSYEHKHIAMNLFTWELILSGLKITSAYEEVAKIFNTNYDSARQSFERKNHDFGERELCRVGLDIFLVLNNHQLTHRDKEIVANILNEPISAKVFKDETHRKNKYKNLLSSAREKYIEI